MSKLYDPIQEYLRERGCPTHVVKTGLKGLVMNWEKVVAELVFDGYRYGLRDFVNDLDRREILAGALDHLRGAAADAGPDGAEAIKVPPAYLARVEAADKRFVDATWAANRCLLDEAEAAERGLSREHHFWFYRVPRRHRANFTKDLKEAAIESEAPAPGSDEG